MSVTALTILCLVLAAVVLILCILLLKVKKRLIKACAILEESRRATLTDEF